MSKKVAFIGHRRIGYGPIKERLEEAIRKEIEDGCRIFTMGIHGDFDKYALGTCRYLRKSCPDMRIMVVLTSLHIIEKKDVFDNYNPFEDVETVIYDIEEEHFKRRITESNRQMIDTCDTLICYVNKKQYQSGAKTAMNYAKRKGLKVINLYHEEDEPTFGMTKEEKKEYYDSVYKRLEEITKKNDLH